MCVLDVFLLSARGLPASLHFPQASLLALQRAFSYLSFTNVYFGDSYGVEGELQPIQYVRIRLTEFEQ